MHIRPATITDIPSIMNLERQSATAAHWTEQQYTNSFRPGGAGLGRLALVAEEPLIAFGSEKSPEARSGILGFLIARHLAPEWELENIVVANTVHRKGIGKKLLESLIAVVSESESNSVFLEVRESNGAARNLYEKAGFEQTGRRRSYYTSPSEDAILYRKTLE